MILYDLVFYSYIHTLGMRLSDESHCLRFEPCEPDVPKMFLKTTLCQVQLQRTNGNSQYILDPNR